MFQNEVEEEEEDSMIEEMFGDDSDADHHWHPNTSDEDSDGEPDIKRSRNSSGKFQHDSTLSTSILQPQKETETTMNNPPLSTSIAEPQKEKETTMNNLTSSTSIAEPQEVTETTMIQNVTTMQDSTEETSSGHIQTPETSNDHDRNVSKKSCCLYCGECVAKIVRHWQRKHSEETDVAKILSLASGSAERYSLIQELKNKGNFVNNSEFLTTGKGNFIPKKVPRKGESENPEDFLPCVYCRAFFKKNVLSLHQKKCTASNKPTRKTQDSHRVQSTAALLLPAPNRLEESFKNKVFGKMKVDNIYRYIRQDRLITEFGNKIFQKHFDEPHLFLMISQRMRELGRLMLEIKNIDSNKFNLESCLNPKSVTTVLDGLKRVCGLSYETGGLKTPTLMLRLVTSVKKCCQICKGNFLILNSDKLIKAVDDFLTLFTAESQILISRSLKTLNKRKWNKPKMIPLANDVKKLNSFIKKEGDALVDEIEKGYPTKENLRRLAENTLAGITCFNRKRVGEVERMPFEECNNLKIGGLESDVSQTLSATEKQLVNCLGRVEVRGKRGRKVAVLITENIHTKIKILCRPLNRKVMGVDPDNPHLFASNSGKCSTLRGCDVLRKYAHSCEAKNPEYLTSTRLRKQLATMTQVMNLNKNELDVIANFMGHDIRIHREFYRLPEDILQVAKVSKVLMNLEKGRVTDLVGNNLNSVNLTENEEVDVSSGDEDSDDETNYVSPNVEPKTTADNSMEATEVTVDHVLTSQEENESRERSKKKGEKTVWSEEECLAIDKFFVHYLTSIKNKPPGKNECEKAKLKYPVLKGRSWDQIKHKVRNLQTKLKREDKAAKPSTSKR